jgi:abortive infection alpha-like protein
MNGPTAEMPMPGEREQAFDDALLRAAPVLARLAAAAWLRAAEWTIGTSVRSAIRIVQGAARGETPADLLQGAEAELREWARQLLGIVNGSTGNGAAPPATRSEDEPPAYVDAEATSLDGHVTDAELRERGAELLRRSASVEHDLDAHPAYARMLTELAPDEARILRLLAQKGPRPAVDVRTGGPMGLLKSDLVAPGLTMIGAEAGCRHSDRLHRYLDNLSRLGLIWFSREQLDDLQLYQVLEAQPDVAEAMAKVGRAKTVRRSIQLTPFGRDFCETCLPLDTAEIEALAGPGPDTVP